MTEPLAPEVDLSRLSVPGNSGLPPCHSRRKFADGGHEFFCAHPRVHATDQLVSASICKICEYWREPPPAEFRPFDPTIPLIRRTGPCFHLGEHVGWKECPTCGGHVRLKVFECRHPLHHQTTANDCLLCRDYVNPLEKPPPSSSLADSDNVRSDG